MLYGLYGIASDGERELDNDSYKMNFENASQKFDENARLIIKSSLRRKSTTIHLWLGFEVNEEFGILFHG